MVMETSYPAMGIPSSEGMWCVSRHEPDGTEQMHMLLDNRHGVVDGEENNQQHGDDDRNDDDAKWFLANFSDAVGEGELDNINDFLYTKLCTILSIVVAAV